MSKQIINIDPNCSDPHYRYKREKIVVKHENANGASTRIMNLLDIAKSLSIKKDNKEAINTLLISIISLMKKSIGLSIERKLKDKLVSIVIRGHVEVEQLENILCRFIVKNVLCAKCKLPEIHNGSCLSCGTHKVQHKSKTEAKVVIHEVEEEEESEEEPELFKEQARYINRLYEYRDTLDTEERYKNVVNKVIDKIWDCDESKKWEKLKIKVLAYLNEIKYCTDDL